MESFYNDPKVDLKQVNSIKQNRLHFPSKFMPDDVVADAHKQNKSTRNHSNPHTTT